MRAVIVYESMFGATKKVAEAIAEGLADGAEVSVVPVTSAGAHTLDGADLVVVAGPTHTHGMSRPGTRKMAGKRAGKPERGGVGTGRGQRPGSARMARVARPAGGRRRRFRYPAAGIPAFTGRASKSIGRHLARHGARIAAPPESFLVEGLTGALAEGELERARAWGQRLTRSDCIRGVVGRRQAS
jgi:Flavodoxin domain